MQRSGMEANKTGIPVHSMPLVLQYFSMKYFTDITCSIIADMKMMKKDFFNYTAAYISLMIISNTLSFIRIENFVIDFCLNLILLTASFLQIVIRISFQRAYIKQKIGNIAFNSIPAVILHLYIIYFVQIILFVIPIAAVTTFFKALNYAELSANHPIALTIKGFLLIFFAWWLARLIFVPTILVYKKESMKMKHIIAESKAIFKRNFVIILPFFLVLYVAAIYSGFKIIYNPTAKPSYFASILKVLLLACSGYISTILYCKLVIDYQLHMVSRYLPAKTENRV